MGSKDAHNICFYYLVSLVNENDIPDNGEFVSQKDNCNVVLGWVDLNDFDNITIYPQFLKEKIHNVSPHIEHFVRRYE